MITFDDRPDFMPCYSPIEMFSLGIFGGAYFKLASDLPGPFVIGSGNLLTCESTENKLNNKYGVISGSPLHWWMEHDLINIDDPNGWVEWYIKFYYGRRHSDDDRQIKRFRAFVTRHTGMMRSYEKKGKDSAKTKQNLLQWAWDFKLDPSW